MNTKFFNNWTNQIRKGLLELTILNDIRNRKMYGYEIEKKLCKSHGLILGNGAIYNILQRLKRQRLVKTAETKSPDGPKRKYYQLTGTGRETLAQMNSYWQALEKQANSIEKGRY
jgi:PadR family transcriptional regulator PadR